MEIPKGIGEFIARDLVFMAGGALVTASVLFRFDRLPTQDTPAAYYLLALAASYAIGFVIQETFSVLRIVTTQHVEHATRPMKWLYRLYTGEQWSDCKRPARTILRTSLDALSERGRAAHERVITHMMIGSTLGPSCLLSAVFTFSKWCESSGGFALTLALGGFVAGLLLLLVNQLKAMQVSAIQHELAAKSKARRSVV
jgi:hypothetical protein